MTIRLEQPKDYREVENLTRDQLEYWDWKLETNNETAFISGQSESMPDGAGDIPC